MRVKVTNWRKFPNSKEWLFDGGIQLIYGPNASGKSSILDAIHFAFLGVNEKIDDNPCNDPSEPTIVVVDFRGIDGNDYRIVRSYKKIKRKEEDFALYRLDSGNEDYLSKEPHDAMKLFGVSNDIFTHIFFLKEGEIYRALSRTKNHLSEEIASIMNLERFDMLVHKLQKVRTSFIKSLKNQVSAQYSQVTIERDGLESEINELEFKIEQLKKEKNEIKDLYSLAQRKAEITENIRKLEKEKLQSGEVLMKLRKKYKEQHDLQAYIKSRIKLLEGTIKQLSKDLSELTSKNYEIKAEIQQITKTIAEITRFKNEKHVTCPTCYQKVNPAILEEARKSFASKKKQLQDQLKDIEDKIRILEKQIEGSNKELDQLRKDLEVAEQSVEVIAQYQEYINDLQKQLRTFPELEDIKKYEEQLEEKEEEIRKLYAEKIKAEEILQSLSTRTKLSPEEVSFQEEFIKLLEKTVKEYKKEILDQKLVAVTNVIKSEWKDLMNEDIWSISFDKQFIPVLNYKGKQRTIRGLSASEKLMLSIIIRAAFMHHIMSNKTLILDDPTISLDEDHIKKAATFYRKVIENKHLNQILISSFNRTFRELLQPDKVIELE